MQDQSRLMNVYMSCMLLFFLQNMIVFMGLEMNISGKRGGIFQIGNPIVLIPNEIIPTDGKNLRYRQLQSIAKTFGIHDDILPRPEIGGDIQEMVNNRNYIAHGNKTPKEVGREVSVSDLQRKLLHISEACTYIVDIYEKYINKPLRIVRLV